MARILLVDDDPLLLDLLQRYLEKRGYETAVGLSAEDALRVFDADRDALIIADLTLPGMGGDELLIRLREKNSALAGILMSGYPTETEIEGAIFLQKPFMPQALIGEIEKLLG